MAPDAPDTDVRVGGAALPPGYALIPTPMPDVSPAADAVRQQLTRLLAASEHIEAAGRARSLPDEILLFGPCEEIADQIRADDPQLAERLYWLAARTYQLEGFWATAGGEGLSAVAALDAVLPKAMALHRDAPEGSSAS